MAFIEPVSPDITESIPARLSGRVLENALQDFGLSADVVIANLPFRLAISDDRPYIRESAPVRKQQFDASDEAGEQSLEQWWVRSQTSWHRGTGITYYEPGTEETTRYRFADSLGVDVWKLGEVRLLHKMDPLGTQANTNWWVNTFVQNGVQYLVVSQGTTIQVYDQNLSAVRTITPRAGLTTETAPIVFGSRLYFGHGLGIDYCNLASDTTTTGLYSQALNTAPRVWWAKGRLMAGRGRSLYELAPDGTTSSGNLDTATAIHTHPSTEWTWTGVAESPGAILAAGYSPGSGGIYRLPLQYDSSGLPVLRPPSQVAEFPAGEEVRSLLVYLSSYVAIGTSAGLRLAVVDDEGSLTYGPLTFETSSPVHALAAYGSFVYAAVQNGVGGFTGAYRVNLGEELEPNSLRFAYATDVSTKITGIPQSIVILGAGRVCISLKDQRAWVQSATEYEPTGYLVGGRVRFGTTEKKTLRYVRLDTVVAAGDGSIILGTLSKDGTETSILTLDSSSDRGEDITVSYPPGPQTYLSLKLTLTAGSSNTKSPTVEAFSLKALPAPTKRQELIQVPLLCVEREVDRYGNTVRGYAFERFAALKTIESSGAVVQFRDNTNGEGMAVVIERVQFQRRTPPQRGNDNWGGIITLTLTKV